MFWRQHTDSLVIYAVVAMHDTAVCCVLSLGQAAMLMKVAANYSRSIVQLIEIEFYKLYLHRALRFHPSIHPSMRLKDSDSDSISCLANVYLAILAILYYATGHIRRR